MYLVWIGVFILKMYVSFEIKINRLVNIQDNNTLYVNLYNDKICLEKILLQKKLLLNLFYFYTEKRECHLQLKGNKRKPVGNVLFLARKERDRYLRKW